MVFTRSNTLPRRGTVALPWLVMVCLVFLAVIFTVYRMVVAYHTQVELENASIAAAHAVAADLATDEVLREDPQIRQRLMSGCRQAGVRFARYNRVGGQPLRLEVNEDNGTDGELVLGRIEAPGIYSFDVRSQALLDLHRPDLNAVRVTLRRNQAAASATVIADHDVIGFQVRPPATNSTTPPPLIPLVPFAILTDPCPPAQHTWDCWKQKKPGSWERQILARQGPDEWRIDPATGRPEEDHGDQIPEIRVVLGALGEGDNLQLVRFNPAGTVDDAVRQAAVGVSYHDLEGRGGQLLLNDGRQPENLVELPRLPPDADGLDRLKRSLEGTLGQPRVWMLYSEVRKKEDSGEQTVAVVGFVVARVMDVAVSQGSAPGRDGQTVSYGQLVATLQPSVKNVSTAVTNYQLRDLGPRTIYNPYISKVRVLE